ncbi:helix-turn-helix domain-containing protein [Rhodococcus jostii]|uniref:helix-turn-helix domain-containing protein n=1 Tax=Rhodococcus jostii TaxID=132919 RepID=UPI00142F324B|nr:helix-turn-helix domain-containing protein [Rhodococcus jostii]
MYAGIPMALARDTKLSAHARSVALLAWSHDEKWQQSAADIAKELGMGRNTVAAALIELEERGWMVREVHYKPGKKVAQVWDFEIWHLQMSNIPFAPDEVERLRQPAPNGSRSTTEPAPNGSRGCSEREQVPAPNRSTIGIDREMHPEMHLSNASTDQETGHGSRSLAVAGPEPTAEDRPAKSRQADPDPEPASAGASEAPEEYRPTGLHPLAQPTLSADPFASEPAWRVEAVASEKRAARLLVPVAASAPHRIPDPFAS